MMLGVGPSRALVERQGSQTWKGPEGGLTTPGPWRLLAGRPTCSGFLLARPPQLTSLAATFLASSTPPHTSFHPACAAFLTPLGARLCAGLCASWRGDRRGGRLGLRI